MNPSTTFAKQYMAKLRAMASQRQPEPTLETQIASTPAVDYRTTIETWWNSQPPRARNHPWSLEVIAAAAFTDSPHRPAMRRVAQALRSLGFVERRDWTKAGRNRRLWIPPKAESSRQPKSAIAKITGLG